MKVKDQPGPQKATSFAGIECLSDKQYDLMECRYSTAHVHRCRLVRLATSAASGFGNYADSLSTWAPEKRLQYISTLTEGKFDSLGDDLTKEKAGIPQCLLHAIGLAAEPVGVGIAGVDKGGSTRTKTAIQYSSDLDLNVRTTRNMTRRDRVEFKDALVALLPHYTDGWTFVHMGKKCIKLQKPLPGGRKREVDIAFMNTTFDWSGVDRAENVAFFRNKPAPQRAVKMFKFCFLDVSGLCGFHIERSFVAMGHSAHIFESIPEVFAGGYGAYGGIFSRYFQDEGVKRFHLDILYLAPALDTSGTHVEALSEGLQRQSAEEELRQRTGVWLSSPAPGLGYDAIAGSAVDGLSGGLEGFRRTFQLFNWTRYKFRVLGAWQKAACKQELGIAAECFRKHLPYLHLPQLQKGFQHLVLELALAPVRMLGCGGEGVLIFLPGINEISEMFDVLEVLEQPEEQKGLQQRRSPCEFKIFVLHSTIPMDEQEQAFKPPSENVCHVFLASTIAESSVTLPKVRVVIDTCLRRQLCPDKSRHGVHCLLTQWVSHASASQRSGRAGRVFPGVSIRLVPRSFYTQHMTQYDAPEIEQAPLEKLYLNVKQLSQRLRERLPRIGSLPPRRLLQLTVQPPPMDRLEEAVCTLAELGALTTRRDETARITVLGRMAIALPLDLRLCRLILFGVLFGCAADAVVMATALGGQDPFTMPMSIVIKDHLKYARAIMRSAETRWHFDQGALSEPIMLRNLFRAWLNGLGPEEATLGGKLRFTSGSNQRHVFVKHAHEFAKSHAVMPKRLTQLALSVVEVAQRTLEFLAPNEKEKPAASPSRQRLEALLATMGIAPERAAGAKEAKSEEMQVEPLKLDVFSEDVLLLKTTLTAAFTPLYAHGITRCMDYTSGLKGPSGAPAADPAKSEPEVVMLKAEPQLAKVHTQALSRPDVSEPKVFFCIPQVPEVLAQQTATDSWSFSMREFTTAGGAKPKKLQVHQGQAFVTYETNKEEDAASEESLDEEIRPPETLIKEVQEQMQLPPLDDLSGDEDRRRAPDTKGHSKRTKSSSSASRRKRRPDPEEAKQSERPDASQADEGGKQEQSKGTSEWQWSTAAARREEEEEAQAKNDSDSEERDKSKERRKEKDKDRKRDKEKEKAKKSKRKAKKKKEEESSKSYESYSSSSRSRRRKKKKEAKRKKKSRSRKKKSRREGEACMEIGSSSDDLEIVAETPGAILALQNAAEPTMETAFEEVTEEQREKQRRRLERFRAMQAGLEDDGDPEGSVTGAVQGKASKIRLKDAGGDSVLAKLRAQASPTRRLADLRRRIVSLAGGRRFCLFLKPQAAVQKRCSVQDQEEGSEKSVGEERFGLLVLPEGEDAKAKDSTETKDAEDEEEAPAAKVATSPLRRCHKEDAAYMGEYAIGFYCKTVKAKITEKKRGVQRRRAKLGGLDFNVSQDGCAFEKAEEEVPFLSRLELPGLWEPPEVLDLLREQRFKAAEDLVRSGEVPIKGLLHAAFFFGCASRRDLEILFAAAEKQGERLEDADLEAACLGSSPAAVELLLRKGLASSQEALHCAMRAPCGHDQVAERAMQMAQLLLDARATVDGHGTVEEEPFSHCLRLRGKLQRSALFPSGPVVAGQKCRPLRRGRRPRARACALRGFRWDEPGAAIATRSAGPKS
ncbi:unnamed protein product [Effrenium voratum]|nr:unnamed protein product [Effrenium voratum]